MRIVLEGERLTNQYWFNKTWQHHIVEGKSAGIEARNGLKFCAYTDEDGDKCGIGVGLTDTELSMLQTALADGTSLNHKSITSVLASKALTIYPTKLREFLSKLQLTHDIAAKASNFHKNYKTNLVALAKEFNLTIPDCNVAE